MLTESHDPEYFRVSDSDSGFYSKDYWFDYLPGQLGQPNVVDRARADLPERAVYWLSTVLRFQRPPGRTLELGCGPGAFVGLMAQAGFEAEGLELSPAVVELARRHFGVTVHCGPIEEQSLPQGQYCGVSAFDVLEHLPDPVGTLERAVELLAPGGWLLLQTPGFREPEGGYERMVETSDHFLEHLKAEEHLYLYSEDALRLLLGRIGLGHVRFLPALYDYDMFAIASREPLVEIEPEEAAQALLGSPSQRMALALLDLAKQKDAMEQRWQTAEQDRKQRLNVILDQSGTIGDLKGQLGAVQEELGRAHQTGAEVHRLAQHHVQRSDSLSREAQRLDSLRRRTAQELVRAMTENGRLQLELCRLRLRELELESRLKRQ